MKFRRATNEDCEVIREIARRIWAPTYAHLMDGRQLEYMFEMMYGPENMRVAMAEGQQFLIFSKNGEDVGYASYETLPEHDFYLQKIYLLPEKQGNGSGKAMLEILLKRLREVDPEARNLGLNVNRHNLKAVFFYLRNGFEIFSRHDKPIGDGYFMYDYVLWRKI